MTTELDLDHLAYIQDRRYRREIHIHLRRMPVGRMSSVNVWHEGDNNCCRREPWDVTARRISAAIAQDGVPNVWAFLEIRS